MKTFSPIMEPKMQNKCWICSKEKVSSHYIVELKKYSSYGPTNLYVETTQVRTELVRVPTCSRCNDKLLKRQEILSERVKIDIEYSNIESIYWRYGLGIVIGFLAVILPLSTIASLFDSSEPELGTMFFVFGTIMSVFSIWLFKKFLKSISNHRNKVRDKVRDKRAELNSRQEHSRNMENILIETEPMLERLADFPEVYRLRVIGIMKVHRLQVPLNVKKKCLIIQ